MIFVIMCGGEYPHFERHKSLTEVNGEPLVIRTLRLLKEVVGEPYDVYVTYTDNDVYNTIERKAIGVYYKNGYRHDGTKAQGYWLDAFWTYYNFNGKPVTYLMGDVLYSKHALEVIAENKADHDVLFGTMYGKKWQEPLGYRCVDIEGLKDAIVELKKMYDEGRVNRNPLVWELYRYKQGIDVNTHILREYDGTYVNIEKGGIDIDYPSEAEGLCSNSDL